MLLYNIKWILSYIGDTLIRGKRNFSDYWNQLLGKILYYPMHTKAQSDTTISSTTRSHARKRLLLLGLMAEYTKSTSVPNIDLSGNIMLKIKLGGSRGKVNKLKICKLSYFELNQVRSVLDIIPSALINKGDTKPIILDTGFSRSDTRFKVIFVKGTILHIYLLRFTLKSTTHALSLKPKPLVVRSTDRGRYPGSLEKWHRSPRL